MFTDIVGYTSLTGSDEQLALKLLAEHRQIVRPLISLHNGREVKTMGDAFLVEFGSATEATRCAFEIQESLHEFNAKKKADEKIMLRIGIHLGDVIHSGKDVFGDAVNVASRIQGLSEPGGICISKQVYDSVRSKLREVRFESIGLRRLKNVKNNVEVFKALTPWREEVKSALYTVSADDEEEVQPRNRIAVLPFANISQNTSDEFFADGLTEELISRLSEVKDLRVIARTSSMNYKNDRQKKIREIGRELGVGTVIEGSVRKAENKIRVTIKAVNAINEEHLWTSKYDRDLDDIFEIQTDIAEKVVESLSFTLAPLIKKQIRESQQREETHDVTAYTYYLHGLHLMHAESEPSVKQAIEFFTRAIEEDKTFARAYVGRADCYLSLTEYGHLPFLDAARQSESDIKKALEFDQDLAEAHATLSHVKYSLDEIRAAEKEAMKAIELNPSLSGAYHALGHIKLIKRRLQEATKLFETAYKLDPLEEDNIIMLSHAYMDQGRDQDALNLWTSVEHLFPQTGYYGMAWYYIVKKEYAKASEFLEKFKLVAGNGSLLALGLAGQIAAGKGERSKALELISEIERTAAKDTIANGIVGLIYYLLGDMDRFFEYMERALEIHALPLSQLVNSTIYAKARNDPRLKKLLEYYDFEIDLSAGA